MAVNIIEPSAYVQRVKIVAESKVQQLDHATLERAALSRAPNYVHKDGRIYASRAGEPYFAVSVSPLNPQFENQIEPGILPVVSALLSKNYLPISSCQGHGDSKSFVRIVFGSEQSADEFILEFGTMDFVTLTKLFTSANIIQSWHNGQPHWRAKQEGDHLSQNLEHQDINLLYKRNYHKVYYVDISLYQTNNSIWKFFSRQKIINDLRRNRSLRIQCIADRILSMKDYEL